MYCPECKINYKGDFKYCVTCNEELLPGKICEHCATINSECAKICNLCGEFFSDDIKKLVESGHGSLSRTYKECVKCHAHFENSKIYCSECGSTLILKTGLSGIVSKSHDGLLSRVMNYFRKY